MTRTICISLVALGFGALLAACGGSQVPETPNTDVTTPTGPGASAPTGEPMPMTGETTPPAGGVPSSSPGTTSAPANSDKH